MLPPRPLYTRLDEFCGGDPHIAASLKRTRTPIDLDIDSKIDEVETLERIAMYWHDPADRDAIAAALDTLGGIEVTRSYAMNIEVMGEEPPRERPSRGYVSTWASVSPTPGRSATTSTTSPCCRQRATAWP